MCRHGRGTAWPPLGVSPNPPTLRPKVEWPSSREEVGLLESIQNEPQASQKIICVERAHEA